MKELRMTLLVFLFSLAGGIAHAQYAPGQYADIVELYESGTDGGSIPGGVTGTYRRNLTIALDDNLGITLDTATGRILLPGGVYRIEASAPANVLGGHRTGVIVFYADTSAGIRYQWWGTSGANYDPSQAAIVWMNPRSWVTVPKVCLETPTWIEIRQYAEATVVALYIVDCIG